MSPVHSHPYPSSLIIQINLENADHLFQLYDSAGGSGYLPLSNEDIHKSITFSHPLEGQEHGEGFSDQRSLIQPNQDIIWRVTTRNKYDAACQFAHFTLDSISFYDIANMRMVLEYEPIKKPGDSFFSARSHGKEHFDCEYCPKLLAYQIRITVNVICKNAVYTIPIKFDPMIQTRENP